MNKNQKRALNISLIGLAIVGVFVIAAALIAVSKFGPFYRTDLKVHVANVGDMELQSVVVAVAGGEYDLGTLMPGKEMSTIISPTGESSITVIVRNLHGETQSFEIEGYIEPKYVGDIRVKLTDRQLVSVERRLFP